MDSKHLFEIFTRQNIGIINNFSAWLIYKWDLWSTYLCRYNWDYWCHKNRISWEIVKWHHKHIYNSDYVNNWLNDDSYAEETDSYNTLNQALLELFKDYNIINYRDFFPTINEQSLF